VADSDKNANFNYNYSKFLEKLKKESFVFTFEVGRLKKFAIKEVLKEVSRVREFFDAFVVPNNPFAKSFPHPLALCSELQRRSGVETVMTICCRDKNRLAIESEVLGAVILNIRNIVVVTGDFSIMDRDIKPVFDIDSIQAVKMIKNIIDGENLLSELKLERKPELHVGVVVNLSAKSLEKEKERFFMKVDAGAEYAFTQMVFDPEVLTSFRDSIGRFPIPIIVSIYPIISREQINFLMSFPSFNVPSWIIEHFREKEKNVKIGIKNCVEIAVKARELGFNGIHVICKDTNLATQLIEEIKQEVD